MESGVFKPYFALKPAALIAISIVMSIISMDEEYCFAFQLLNYTHESRSAET